MCPVTDYYLTYAKEYIDKELLYENVLGNPEYRGYIYKHMDYLDIYLKKHQFFLDEDHLNYEGATFFSKLVASELFDVMREIMDAAW